MVITDKAYTNRPTRAEISIGNLINNFKIVKSLISNDVKTMVMVKANAYGHGIKRVSQELLNSGADYIGVAYLEEAVFLRENGITAPILVLGAINTEQVRDFIEYDVEITSSSIDKSMAISKIAKEMGKTARIHLKIDTGMERIGVHWYNSENFLKGTLELENILVKGIFSHLARAESDYDFTGLQVSRFNEIITTN